LSLIGCQPHETQVPAAASTPDHQTATPPATPPTPPPAPITKADWDAALKATFKESLRKTDDDGNVDFLACFGAMDAASGKGVCASGLGNPFTKMTTFKLPTSELRNLAEKTRRGGIRPYLDTYVTLIDCRRPTIVLSPYLEASGWLFLRRVAVMADGEIVLERSFDHNDVRRDNDSDGVTEQAYWVLSDGEVKALRAVPKAKQVIVRLMGDKGYVNLRKEWTQRYIEDLPHVLLVYDVLGHALSGKLPNPSEAGCKLPD